ncbi:uncharacterized protein si:dkey-32e6.3 isoform X1 [Erpetoichthys calabaricus]|uniref:Si:dkey-32e6.3 n=1 Tax=Erpetoichthys calabaricus TaxID=27687 RepID=A0A8C4TBN6_ERPCA|nr:uncharacterized protein si:dkey-32e6.3 isoform X1 [Erpetoichthys calabaricus]
MSGLATGPIQQLNPPEQDTERCKRKHSDSCQDCGPSSSSARHKGLNCSPAREIAEPKRRKLVLHFDLNNTIVVSDAATKQDTVKALDYFLSTVTWGRLDKEGRWEWLSDLPSLLPPCPGAVSYYYQFGRVPAFTESADGVQFRRILEYHLSLLEWHGEEDKVLSVSAEDGKVYHWILPAFFQLLQALSSQHREFAILFRTFGTDLPRVLVSMQKVLKEGGHPLFCDIQSSHVSLTITPGRIRCSKNNVKLTRGNDKVISRGDDRRLYQYFSSLQGIGGFQDHFDWWVRNSFSSLGGKPVWIDPYDPDVQHIFIDDNIRLNDADTIVNPKVFIDKESHLTRTAPTSEFYNVNLVQTDLLMAISNQNYFIDCIRACEENYEKYLQESDN